MWVYVNLELSGASTMTWNNLVMELYVTSRYLGTLVLPYNQSIVPAVAPVESLFESRVLISIGLLALLMSSAYVVRRRWPIVSFGAVWFLLALMPSAALLVLADVGQAMAEHRAYLASCGVFMAFGSVAAAAFPLQRPLTNVRFGSWCGGIALLLALFLVLTVQRNRVWSDPVTLWQDAVRSAPQSWFPRYGAGDAYRTEGNLVAAAAAYEAAIALYPGHLQVYIDLASVLIELERFGRAKEVLEQALKREPASNQVRLMLASLEGDVFRNAGRALTLCREAARSADSAEAEECIRRNESRISTAPTRSP